jgi:cytosine deaminase
MTALPTNGELRLCRAKVPVELLDGAPPLPAVDAEGFVLAEIEIRDGRIAAIHSSPGLAAAEGIDLERGLVWPALVDMHTHLDKAFIGPRTANPDGTVAGAVQATRADREARWTAEDVRRRFDFALRCAYAHGTAAVRTHLDCDPPQAGITWPVFADLRAAWAGRIELQGVAKVPVEFYLEAGAEKFVRQAADYGGMLGGVTRVFGAPAGKETAILDKALNALFRFAQQVGVDVDLHVDETSDPAANSLAQVARAARRQGYSGRVICGHCCSLAVQPPEVVESTLQLCAEAGIAVVTLPLINLYLQDRATGTTPRWRGITLVHELAARGIPVTIASDNCRDPFHAYGDFDLFDVFAQSVRIAHLDLPYRPWLRAVTSTPADLMRLPQGGRIKVGAPADLILFRARTMSELLARSQSDRIVLRAGRPIATTPPDFRELDDLYP